MAAGRRPDAAAQYFPARSIDVSTTEQVVRDAVQAAMRRRRYSAHSTTADGVTMYRFGSPGLGLLSAHRRESAVLRPRPAARVAGQALADAPRARRQGSRTQLRRTG
ncbi:MAG: hypothetical protein JWM51_637 [Microbacteriaceae bacterium]|nr:hypothetical protein [Microbacteriaceae bacterium]